MSKNTQGEKLVIEVEVSLDEKPACRVLEGDYIWIEGLYFVDQIESFPANEVPASWVSYINDFNSDCDAVADKIKPDDTVFVFSGYPESETYYELLFFHDEPVFVVNHEDIDFFKEQTKIVGE